MSSYGENGVCGKVDIVEVMLVKFYVVFLIILVFRYMFFFFVLVKVLVCCGVKVMFLCSVINNFEMLCCDVEDEVSLEELDIFMGFILEDFILEFENLMELKLWLFKFVLEYRVDWVV